MQHMNGNNPKMFDCWVNQVGHLLQLKSSMASVSWAIHICLIQRPKLFQTLWRHLVANFLSKRRQTCHRCRAQRETRQEACRHLLRSLRVSWTSIQKSLEMGQPGLFFVYFRCFQTNIKYNFYNKSMWKNVNSIQYTAPGFEPTTSQSWVISHNH